MFGAEAPSVSMFCDEGNHDRYAPTKHNSICERKSTFEVIIKHPDFATSTFGSSHQNSQIQNTTPRITFKKQNTTRFVIVVENTKDMLIRESWKFLRISIRKLVLYDLPEDANVEVGMVATNETGSVKLLNIVSMKGPGIDNRDQLSSAVPYAPGDSSQSPCLHCALKEAIEMLNERTKASGPANNVVIVIAPGMNRNANIETLMKEARKSKVKMATINYPEITRVQSLDILAEGTGGEAYTVAEKKVNVDTSVLTTYFQLSNVLHNIVQKYCTTSNLPMEIHRREIRNDGRNSITGSFMLDANMGEPARFMLYTHDVDTPLIKSLTLTSPSQEVFTRRSDILVSVKIISLTTNISEPGTWTYTIEPFVGNPQPHFLQVMATPKTKSAQVVRGRFWIKRSSPNAPLTLYTEVKRGDYPVMGAKIEVLVTKTEINGTVIYKETLELLDTGSGDPDITKGDGVYSRYYSAAASGPGTYTFEVTASDNGNTAYSWTDAASKNSDTQCCGSRIRTSNVEPINPFQRVLPARTVEITSDDIDNELPVGRIGDLKVDVKPEDMKALLTWTSPDMGGHNVARYEVKYARSVQEIVDKYDTNTTPWEGRNIPFILATGSETTFTIDMSQDRDLLDKPLFFAIRAYAQISSDSKPGPVSNWIRVLVPSPPPPPTVAPTYTTNDSSWPFLVNQAGSDNLGPSVAKTMNLGLEIILPVIIGILFLIVLLTLYCYFCVIKRRTNGGHKSSKANQIKTDKLNSTITIVPSSPLNMPQNTQQDTYQADYPAHHTVGVPVSNYGYEDEPKKRYSLVHQQEQQLIEELKQQQMQHDQMNSPNNNYGALSVISNNTLQRNGQTLSPYNSWSASQLLHEHERRHSPMDGNMMQDEQLQHHDAMSQLDHMSISGQNPEHMQVMGQVPEHYVQGQFPPPVPPLPAFNANGYPVNYNIYGVHQPIQSPNQQGAHQIYQSMQRNETLVPFNPSLQGSMSSVNSGEKKRRNVTMV